MRVPLSSTSLVVREPEWYGGEGYRWNVLTPVEAPAIPAPTATTAAENATQPLLAAAMTAAAAATAARMPHKRAR